jgi:VWFA-related protein
MRKILLLTLLCGLPLLMVVAQQPPPTKQAPPQPVDLLTQPQNLPSFTVTLQQVLTPVLVVDRKGNIINGLQPDQFRLYDNGKEQSLTSVDVTYTPISMVIAVQANELADKILPQVNKIGVMLKPIVLGDNGEAAVIAYDKRVRLMQPFTSDADDITRAIKAIRMGGSSSSRTIDAVEQSVFLLNHRDKNRRRILLMIGENRDQGSLARARETLEKAELANVLVYWVDMSHFVGTMTDVGNYDPRPDALPPASHPVGGGFPTTPTTVDQAYGSPAYYGDWVPLLEEVFRDVKNIFKVPTATLFTRGTGGNQFSFVTQKGLEKAVAEIGEQLHSQYIITYSPNNKADGGFHRISVEVIGHDFRCETKPGYYMSSVFH